MFEPELLIIDGAANAIISRSRQPKRYLNFEIRVGRQELVILLPHRLFCLIGALAMLRDTGSGASWETPADIGFVHSDRLGLPHSLAKQYTYCLRNEIWRQTRLAQTASFISETDTQQLLSWPVVESGSGSGRRASWRCCVAPEHIQVNPRVLDFTDARFHRIAEDYFSRHPTPTSNGNFQRQRV